MRTSEQGRMDRFDRAMTRLMQAHQEALEACERVLDHRDEPRPVGDDVFDLPGVSAPLDATEPLNAYSARSEDRLYRVALEEVRTILESASEEVQLILGEENEGG